MREAPSLVLMNDIWRSGKNVKIRAYDPIAIDACRNIVGDKNIYYATSMYDALDGADALVLVTEWKEFRTPDWAKIKGIMNNNVVIDGRNIFNDIDVSEFRYKRIG